MSVVYRCDNCSGELPWRPPIKVTGPFVGGEFCSEGCAIAHLRASEAETEAFLAATDAKTDSQTAERSSATDA